MWPWEHLAVGYLCFSLLYRLWTGTAPGGPAAVALAVATQLPDLVDKPLAWWLGVLPSGHSLAHSLPFFLVLVAGTWVLAGGRIALPVAVGHFSHLLGDVVFPAMVGGDLSYEFLLWPLVSQPAGETTGILLQVDELFEEFLEFLATPTGLVYLAFEATLVGVAVLLWMYDGLPGLAPSSFRSEEVPADP